MRRQTQFSRNECACPGFSLGRLLLQEAERGEHRGLNGPLLWLVLWKGPTLSLAEWTPRVHSWASALKGTF